MSRRCTTVSPGSLRQRGFALVVAILLLLILTVFSLFATNVGVFEQRTSANEYRSKAVAQVADAALNHGAEALRTLDNDIGPAAGEPIDATRWQLCAASDLSFPCGAEPDATRRARSYRFVGGVDLDGDGTTSVYEQRSINFPSIVGQNSRLLVDRIASSDPANPFGVRYQVGLLLCRVDKTVTAAGTSQCTTTLANTSENRAYMMVARASMVGEQASATFTKTVVPIEEIQLNPKVPSVVASGVMRGLGNATIVPNPNSGGFGVPVSFWSREDLQSSNGSWQTCHYDAWVRNSSTVIYQGVSVCAANNDCGCPSSDELSSGGPQGVNEGIDILDNEGSSAHVGTLLNTREFPRDLMEFLWGPSAQARDRDTNGDGWNDTASELITDGRDPQVGQSKRAVTFLRNAGFQELKTCADVTANLNASASGKYWISALGCKFPRGDIGSPDNPVQIVADGGIDLNTGMRVFGIIFGRDPSAVNVPAGGTAQYAPGGGAAEVYGALVVEGGGTTNATTLVVYDAKTLQSGGDNFNPNVASVPGSWSDRISY